MSTQDSNFNTRVGDTLASWPWGAAAADPNGRWSQFMTDYNIGGFDDYYNEIREYSWTVTFNDYGKQTFYAVADDTGEVLIDGVHQFHTGWMGREPPDARGSRTTPGYFAPGEHTVKVKTQNTGSGPWGIAVKWTGFVAPPLPTISDFYSTPNPQKSLNGTPQYGAALHFSSSGTNITSANINGVSVGSSGTLDISDLPQSNADGTSPAEKDYTFTVCNNRGCVSSTITVKAYNDNTPSNNWTTSFTGLEPDTMYTKTLGTLSGVDMPTTISALGDSNYVGKNGSFGGSINYDNEDTVQLRTTSLPFNTNMSDVEADATLGNTHSKTIEVTTPSGTFDVTFTTRAPRVEEDFDFPDNKDKYPYEDIDFIPNNPQEFITSALYEVKDIEIAQEISVDKPDAQVRINNAFNSDGTEYWQNVREI